MCVGGWKVEDILVGLQIYFTDWPSSLNHTADHQRDWPSWHVHSLVGCSVTLFWLHSSVLWGIWKPHNRLFVPPAPTSYFRCHTRGDEPEFAALVSTGLTAISKDEFAAACSRCPELCTYTQIAHAWPTSHSALDPECTVINWFCVKMHLTCGAWRVAWITDLRPLGNGKTKQCLRDIYWWPKIDTSVADIISACQLYC